MHSFLILSKLNFGSFQFFQTEVSIPQFLGGSPSMPMTPMATPATHSSPTKMLFQRDRTRSPLVLRDGTLSPMPKMSAPMNSPNQSVASSPEQETRGGSWFPEA